MRRYEEMEIKGPHRDAGDPARDRHGGRDPLAWLHLERRVDWPGAAQVLRYPGRRGLLHGDPAARLVPAGVPLRGPGPADLPAGPEQGAGRRGWFQLVFLFAVLDQQIFPQDPNKAPGDAAGSSWCSSSRSWTSRSSRRTRTRRRATRLVPAGVPLRGPGPADLPAGPEQGA